MHLFLHGWIFLDIYGLLEFDDEVRVAVAKRVFIQQTVGTYNGETLYVGCVVASTKRGWVREAGWVACSGRVAAPLREKASCVNE